MLTSEVLTFQVILAWLLWPTPCNYLTNKDYLLPPFFHRPCQALSQLTQLEFDAVIAAVEFERRVLLAVEDAAPADERLALLAVLRSEWGQMLRQCEISRHLWIFKSLLAPDQQMVARLTRIFVANYDGDANEREFWNGGICIPIARP